MRRDKVYYKNEVYEFVRLDKNEAIIRKDKNTVITVPREEVKSYHPLTEEYIQSLYSRHKHGFSLERIIIELVEAIAEEKGWELENGE